MAPDAHVNQAGGEFRPIDHPAVSGRELELRRLVDNVRRLVDGVVHHVTDAGSTAALADRVGSLADELDAVRPDAPFGRFADFGPERGPHDGSPFDLIIGIYNPLSVPVEMSFDGERAVGHAVYTAAFEGAPGCVHGAAIAGAFDMVLSAATSRGDLGGPTAWLRSDYRRRTLLGRPVRYEGWVDEVDGRKVLTRGRLIQDDEVTVESSALFISLPRAEVLALADREPRPS